MDFEKYSERARGFLQAAQTRALGEGHQRFAPEHLLKVIIDDREGLAANLIKSAGGDLRLPSSRSIRPWRTCRRSLAAAPGS